MTTTTEFAELLADHRAALKALYAADGTDAESAAGERYRAAFAAVVAARPTDPATMGAQLKWLLEQGALYVEDKHALLAIADRLEEMAPWSL